METVLRMSSADSGRLIDGDIYVECFLVLFFVFLVFLWTSKRSSKLPPGPWTPPIVGHLFFLGKEPYKFLNGLRKKYGSVFSLYLGRKFVVVLGDFPAIQEAYSKEEFLGRPLYPPNLLIPNTISFSTSSGHLWKTHRRFALQSLRDAGFAKSVSEKQIQEEIACFLKEMENTKGMPFDMKQILASSISNVIMLYVVGRRLDYRDPARLRMDDILKTLTLFFKPTSIHAYFPWMKKVLIPLKLWGYGSLKDVIKDVREFMRKELEEHRRTLDTSNPRDYMDKFLIEMENGNSKDSRNSTFTEKMLFGNVISLMAGGTEPALATIDWVFVTMATFPEVQRRIQKEIDEVIGRDKLPSWTDHLQMPYTQASIMEVQRWKTIVPINMLRCTQGETNIQGYTIPKGTMVISNLWAVHHDPKYWPDPDQYNPERFLEDGKVKKLEYFIPFSYGKRNCPGMTLGKMEVFLYLTSALQKYTVHFAQGETSNNGELGVTLNPRSYQLRFISRTTKMKNL